MISNRLNYSISYDLYTQYLTDFYFLNLKTRQRNSSKTEKLMQQYEEDEKEFAKKVAKMETRKIAPELSDLIIYFISVSFKQQTLEDVKSLSKVAGGRCETMSSLNESTANLRMVRYRKAFQVYHQKQISRVYPKVMKQF